jgi:hypothetical protein
VDELIDAGLVMAVLGSAGFKQLEEEALRAYETVAFPEARRSPGMAGLVIRLRHG